MADIARFCIGVGITYPNDLSELNIRRVIKPIDTISSKEVHARGDSSAVVVTFLFEIECAFFCTLAGFVFGEGGDAIS